MITKSSLLVLTSQIFAVIVHSLAKFLETSGEVNPQQILQIRMFVTLSLNSLYLSFRCPKELPLGSYDIKHLLILRALAGICGSFGFYYSLQYLSLADATILNLLAPLVTGLLSKQRHTYLKLVLATFCICGVGLVVKPAFIFSPVNHGYDYVASGLGLLFAMLGVVGGVCSYSAMSLIGHRAHPLAITNCFATVTLFISSFDFAFVPGVNFDFNLHAWQWALLVLIGVFSALMEYFLTAGLTSEKDGLAIYMLYLQVVFALVVDMALWDVVPDIGSLVGSLLIVGTVLFAGKCHEKGQNLSDVETLGDTGRFEDLNYIYNVELIESEMLVDY